MTASYRGRNSVVENQPVDPLDGDARMKRGLESDVPQIYFNGFINVLGIADVLVTLERNGRPVATLNMSYTTAKTLALSLAQVVAQLEEATGRDMLTTEEVHSLVSKAQK